MITELLEQHNDPRRCVIVPRVAPYQADDMQDGRQVLGKVGKVGLLELVEETFQRRQVDVDVVSLLQS